MHNMKSYNSRSGKPVKQDEPGIGDDAACEKCGAIALDTGLECTECGHDNYKAITGKTFEAQKRDAL